MAKRAQLKKVASGINYDPPYRIHPLYADLYPLWSGCVLTLNGNNYQETGARFIFNPSKSPKLDNILVVGLDDRHKYESFVNYSHF